jgi:hypothetical protein
VLFAMVGGAAKKRIRGSSSVPSSVVDRRVTRALCIYSSPLLQHSLSITDMPSPVKLYVYDLSNGMVRAMSMQVVGRQIDGIW